MEFEIKKLIKERNKNLGVIKYLLKENKDLKKEVEKLNKIMNIWERVENEKKS